MEAAVFPQAQFPDYLERLLAFEPWLRAQAARKGRGMLRGKQDVASNALSPHSQPWLLLSGDTVAW